MASRKLCPDRGRQCRILNTGPFFNSPRIRAVKVLAVWRPFANRAVQGAGFAPDQQHRSAAALSVSVVLPRLPADCADTARTIPPLTTGAPNAQESADSVRTIRPGSRSTVQQALAQSFPA